MFLISDAMAAAGTTGAKGMFGNLQGLMLPVILLIVFYFLLIRPQQKKAKAQKKLLGEVERGDKIVTNSGIIGVIAKPVNPEDTEISLEIAPGVIVLIKRAAIGGVAKKSDGKNTDKPKQEKKARKKGSKHDHEEESKHEEESNTEEEKSHTESQVDESSESKQEEAKTEDNNNKAEDNK